MATYTDVWVVTKPEDGWDCVRGVYTTKEGAYKRILDDKYDPNLSEGELNNLIDESGYVIHDERLDWGI